MLKSIHCSCLLLRHMVEKDVFSSSRQLSQVHPDLELRCSECCVRKRKIYCLFL